MNSTRQSHLDHSIIFPSTVPSTTYTLDRRPDLQGVLHFYALGEFNTAHCRFSSSSTLLPSTNDADREGTNSGEMVT